MLFFAKYLSLHRDIQPFAEYAVTPCMGVWIETYKNSANASDRESHPVWVCGLKRSQVTRQEIDNKSHPVWVCGLKPDDRKWGYRGKASHPVWVCGLKQFFFVPYSQLWKSHPVWVCGLKPSQPQLVEANEQSHPVWVCGLKQWIVLNNQGIDCHTLYGCVD